MKREIDSIFLPHLFYVSYCLDANIHCQSIKYLINQHFFFGFVQTSSDGTQSEITSATTSSYAPSIDDIGFFISVSCEPVRSDWARGPMVLSEQIGPIIPGTDLFLFY